MLAALLSTQLACSDRSVPSWITYPDENWETISPEEAGLGPFRPLWERWVRRQKLQGNREHQARDRNPSDFGIVITRGGYILQTWGDPDYRVQTASVGKSFTKALIQLAIDEGRIGSVHDLVHHYWTGEGKLDQPHKYLDRGHHVKVEFDHLWKHIAGFPVTNGNDWRQRKKVPGWARWSGDPGYDNYAHIQPGLPKYEQYSSGGYWRLNQILTVVFGQDLKDVMQEHIFDKLGIPPERWDWWSGAYARAGNIYPSMPHYADFLDPPYEIGGHVVRAGPGLVIISARDLARWGHLIVTRGVWKGVRLLSDTELLDGHRGAWGSWVHGFSDYRKIALAVVTAEGSLRDWNNPIFGWWFVGSVRKTH